MTRLLLCLLALSLSGCATLNDYRQRHPVITTIAVAALVGSLAWNASTDYSRYFKPGKPCQGPENCR